MATKVSFYSFGDFTLKSLDKEDQSPMFSTSTAKNSPRRSGQHEEYAL